MFTTFTQKKQHVANRLVPYIQDVNKWTEHYISKARRQTQGEEMLKDIQMCSIRPTVVSEHVQLMAQAKSDLNKEKVDVYERHAPIKAKPEFEESQSSPTPKRKYTSSTKSNKKQKTKSSNTKITKKSSCSVKDIFE